VRRPNISWKLVGLAGLMGVAATGAVVARRRRAQGRYDPDELRDRLHRRMAEATPTPNGSTAAADSSTPT
jgi:ribose 1,5-bisphosphokinase PhnN